MARPEVADTASFRSRFGGTVLAPGEPEYDSARAVWNGAIDRKPALIARCHDAGQVAAAVNHMWESRLGRIAHGAVSIEQDVVADVLRFEQLLESIEHNNLYI